MAEQTLYDLLGVSPNAKLTDITRAYNRHKSEVTRDTAPPDLKRETLIREAYETLSDDARRAAYDASLVVVDRGERSRARAAWFGVIGLVLAGAGIYFFKPPPEPVVAARTSQEIFAEASPSIGRVHSIDVTGSSLPVGMAFAIGDGTLVTTCEGITPTSQLVVKIPPRSIPARVATVDAELGLCRLAVEGVGSRPLDLSRRDPRTGDLVYAAKVNAAGGLYLAPGKVKNVVSGPKKVVEANASGIRGAPLLDMEGHVVAIATNGEGRHIPVPAAWVDEARAPRREATPSQPEPATQPSGAPGSYPVVPKTIDDIPPERREKIEKAYSGRDSKMEEEIGKMK